MIVRRFEGSDVMETVLHAVQPVKGAMSCDTPRVGRSVTPQVSEAFLTESCESQPRKWDSGATNTSGDRHDSGAQASAGEGSQSSHYVNQQTEMENCMLRGQNQSFTIDFQKPSSALQAAQSSNQFVRSEAQAHVASLSHKDSQLMSKSKNTILGSDS